MLTNRKRFLWHFDSVVVSTCRVISCSKLKIFFKKDGNVDGMWYDNIEGKMTLFGVTYN